MGLAHLDHLNLSVNDLEETTAWYRRVFGFEPVESGDSGGVPYRILRAGEALLCIYEHPGFTQLDDGERARRGLHAINHFGLRITDPAAFAAHLARERIPVAYGGAIRYPRSTSWYLVDPSGYELEVAAWDGDRVGF